MEDKKKAKSLPKHPEDTSNFVSNWLFCWVYPVIIKGSKTEITEDLLYETPESCKASKLGDELQQSWLEELKLKKPSLGRALAKQFGREFAIYGAFFFPVDFSTQLFQPYFLQKLLNYYTPNQTHVSRNDAILSVVMISLMSFIRLLVFHRFFSYVKVLAMKMRVACSSLIYKKCLNLRKTSLQKISTGQLINLVTNDVGTFDYAVMFLHFIWIGPVELIIGTFFIDVTIGQGATIGILVLLVCFLLQSYVSKYTASNRERIASSTDYRIRLLNDLVCGIQIIKMYAWEKPFKKLIEIARKSELKEISKTTRLFVLNDSINYVVTRIIVFLGILGAIFTGVSITSQYVFTMASDIYDHFRVSLTIFAPLGIMHFGELRTSIFRIQEFLLTDHESSKESFVQHKDETASPGIKAKNVSVKWDVSLTDFVLKDIKLSATCGQLVGIVGPAGSGKSAILQTLIQETEIISGKITIKGRISYASQEAWIFSASVRQNILFGEEMDEEKYRKVLKVCALEHDLAIFPYGDNTLVGERGVMLSGGQKARINLARSVYRDADIYLLDDPLSAVDAQVARIIFKECVQNYLKDKCVILVTHQLSYLQEATKIYSLKDGRLECIENIDKIPDYIPDSATNAEEVVIKSNERSVLPNENVEERGKLKAIQIYKSYFTVGGKSSFFRVILIYSLLQFVSNCLDYFVSFWVNVEQGSLQLESRIKDFFSYENCLTVYCCFLLLLFVIIFAYSWAFVKYTRNASTHLHNEMLTKVLHADLSFFHNNSSGRILNRFSMDVGSVDQKVPLQLISVLPTVMTCLGTCVLISVLNYWMIFPTIALFPIYYYLGVLFQPTVRSIKRTEGITRSPVYSQLTATLQGLSTIKAFGAQEILQKEFDKHQNVHSSAFHTIIGVYALLGLIAEFMSALYTTAVSFSFFIFGKEAYIGNVGLAIHLAIQLTGSVEFLMRIWSSLDTEITSVERVLDYTKIPQEIEGNICPPKSWPSKGRISFQSVCLKYSPTDPPVLKNVTFTIKPGEKIGIIGRTGAGKSSLVSTLFHLFPFEGTILIDNVDTKSIPLKDLRSKISVIPQDPVLFLGTLRKNLDPFDEFTDAELWSALEDVELKSVIRDLESEVSEGGSNFSVGQKQLLCLVRAMLRRNKIVVLDEATANIDLKTDELIQLAIRRKFQESTVLTIAHRLNTVLDSDRILVMDGGVVVEFGSPNQLLEDTDSYFYQYFMQGNKNQNLEMK
ncbi:probable multidrug resistance-associated protein lethal(2)03659 [Tribolium castaneum]|uniref:probable multidrug resistance-associated protein lethal(2)03659 n=1 Tax=Tribolium castaneum TaxID=7070 RepID=UPI0000D56D08|nr:PREDICTED: probable multidrug resistance-associated protein lethal(2)03659 [Tribolium castaneum]|eukprot:XP_015838295.1 PREDICTED: probable multidrug resistance-associated protein lethal(2)03659 [Tribolium castaneum]